MPKIARLEVQHPTPTTGPFPWFILFVIRKFFYFSDVNEVTETTQSSDSFSSSVTISSSASSAISVTIATDTSTPETKQEVNQKEDRHTLLDISTSKAGMYCFI